MKIRVVSVNVDEPGSSHVSSSHQRQRIVQRDGRTIVESESEERESSGSSADGGENRDG